METGPGLSRPTWEDVGPGIEFARVRIRGIPVTGSPHAGVVRLDPDRVRIEPHHESEYPEEAVFSLEAWQRRLGAPVVVNAGLYDERRRHLGILRRSGIDLGGLVHRNWKGLLAADARSDSIPGATLIDLGVTGDSLLASAYETQVQTMVLLDRTGRIRVRRSERIAPRTLVALEAGGRILFLVTEGSVSLHDAARLLAASGDLVLALALDGGREAGLYARLRDGTYTTRSARGGGRGSVLDPPVSLPAVLAVRPAESGP